MPSWQSKLEESSRLLPGRAELGKVGERFLLHGSSPERILDILHEGFNASLASLHGIFGAGCYFAEDSEKIDQYARPDSKEMQLKELHERIWRSQPHPGTAFRG